MDATRGIDEEAVPTLFEWAGGGPALLRLTTIFYEKYVPEDPLLGPLFANMAPDHPERVAAWLGEVFGGPRSYSEHFGGYDRMVSRHIGKTLREEQRARWVQLLCRAADDAGLPTDPEWRAAFVAYLEWGSRIAVENSQPGAEPPPHMPVPRWWWVRRDTRLKGVGSRRAGDGSERRAPRSRRAGQLRTAHQAALSRRRSSIMRFAFDLWSHEEAPGHAGAILDRVRAGTMPCDGAWPEDRVAVFERWIDSGKAA